MKMIKKMMALALSSCLALGAIAVPAHATADPYQYTVVLYSGTGTFADGTTSKSFTYDKGAHFDGYASIDALASDVSADSRYYVKGVRLAGDDNTDYISDLSSDQLDVNRDMQLVVTYGLVKDRVPYTVNFVDEDGNVLAEPQTFYGSIGDKPTAAYLYIERYLPNAYAITGTLGADPQDNVFTFVYRPIPEVNFIVDEPAAEGAEPAAEGGAAAGAGIAPGDAAAVEAAAAEGELVADDGTPLAAPEDVIDIDDEETPLASSLDKEQSATTPLAWPLIIGGISLALLAAVLIVLFFAFRRSKDDGRKGLE